MTCGIHPRVEFIGSKCILIGAMCVAIVFPTTGLAVPVPEEGGSPTLAAPPAKESTTRMSWPSRWEEYEQAAVATDAEPCAKIGADIMREGGSAVDGAIAAMLCVGVVNCHSTGVGGGHFMTIYDYPRGGDSKELTTSLSREVAPAAAYEDMFVNDTDAAVKGGLSIAVPGEVAGFMKAHELYGKAEWSSLFSASIDLCFNGFTVGNSLASAIRYHEQEILSDENLREIFADEDGNIKQEGDTIINEKLGHTLEILSVDPESYYTGDLAQDIIADIQEYDGIITLEDLGNYATKVKPPLEVQLGNGGFSVYAPTAPAGGAVYEYMLNILDGYNFQEADIDEDEIIQTYHRVMEAFKFAYAKRSDLGDEDFVDVEVLLQNMTSSDYGDYIRSRINESYTQEVEYYEPSFDLIEDAGTAHVAVFGPDGTAVSITSTINLLFGSGVRGSRTGILFNDEMDDFSTPGTYNAFGVPASPSNYIVPGKMPMSSMSPALVFKNDDLVLAIGGSGGTRISTAIAWITTHSLWFGMPANEATDYTRLHHQLVPNEVEHEPDFNQVVLSGLEDKKHVVTDYGRYMAQVQTIENTCNHAKYSKNEEESSTHQAGCILAVCDGRKDGVPDGF